MTKVHLDWSTAEMEEDLEQTVRPKPERKRKEGGGPPPSEDLPWTTEPDLPKDMRGYLFLIAIAMIATGVWIFIDAVKTFF